MGHVSKQQNIQDYEIFCLACGRITTEDEVHIIAGKMGDDFDVLCTQCFERYQSAQGSQDLDLEGLDRSGLIAPPSF